ncbi:MAG: hypothetical protein LBS90_07455 [Oscillospiraceae bacterium]|jgi:hypothetical protein|nr:hypothetical protein [Oscillospiraceae bacterium]
MNNLVILLLIFAALSFFDIRAMAKTGHFREIIVYCIFSCFVILLAAVYMPNLERKPILDKLVSALNIKTGY